MGKLVPFRKGGGEKWREDILMNFLNCRSLNGTRHLGGGYGPEFGINGETRRGKVGEALRGRSTRTMVICRLIKEFFI